MTNRSGKRIIREQLLKRQASELGYFFIRADKNKTEPNLGLILSYRDSIACCNGFKQKHLQVIKQKYDKSDIKIYSKMYCYSNEKKSIVFPLRKHTEHEKNCNRKLSRICLGTTAHILIREIKKEGE